jgi:hypothetical protein
MAVIVSTVTKWLTEFLTSVLSHVLDITESSRIETRCCEASEIVKLLYKK